MMNVGSILTDPAFSQTFTVFRQNGTWNGGEWTSGTETPLTFTGVITTPDAQTMDQIPEGDRAKGAICIYSQSLIQKTNSAGTADQILWNGDSSRYRVSEVWPFVNYGYYKAVAVRMDGE